MRLGRKGVNSARLPARMDAMRRSRIDRHAGR